MLLSLASAASRSTAKNARDRADIEVGDGQFDITLSRRMGGLWYLEEWIWVLGHWHTFR